MCCGSKRSAWRGASASAPRRAAPPPATSGSASAALGLGATPLHFAVTKLHYGESVPIRLIGPITGRAYMFSGADPIQDVDVRDAAVLGRSELFLREAP
jgi:hypothetical protein